MVTFEKLTIEEIEPVMAFMQPKLIYKYQALSIKLLPSILNYEIT